MSTRSGRRRGGNRPSRWEPPACWCGLVARRWVRLVDPDGRQLFTLPVCDDHGHPESMPPEIKIQAGMTLVRFGVEYVRLVSDDGWRLYAAEGEWSHGTGAASLN